MLTADFMEQKRMGHPGKSFEKGVTYVIRIWNIVKGRNNAASNWCLHFQRVCVHTEIVTDCYLQLNTCQDEGTVVQF